ncbi:MAG: fatty acid desaturase [Chlorobia bacterium]|nr:fatty acid desaturase [Fimbriimonadaceae bacterium]
MIAGRPSNVHGCDAPFSNPMMNNLSPAEAYPRYRQILRRELPEHYLKPDNHHLIWFAFHAIVISGALWLMSAYFRWWLAPFLGLAIGHSVGCLGFIGHEICHGGAIKNKKLRHLLAGIAFSPYGIGPYLWNRWHNSSHHGHTQSAELDPDRLFLISEYQENPVLKWLYRMSPKARNFVIFSFFSLMMTQHNITMILSYLKDPKSSKRDKAVILFQFILPKAVWITVTALLGWEILLLGYVLPLLIGNAIVISYISTNHFLNPLADENDVLASSLSVTWPKWLAWVDIMHCRFGAHVAHHLFPHAPSRHARKIEEHIEKLWPDRFHVMPFGKALKLLAQTPWVYDTGGVRLINPETGASTETLGRGLTTKPVQQ